MLKELWIPRYEFKGKKNSRRLKEEEPCGGKVVGTVRVVVGVEGERWRSKQVSGGDLGGGKGGVKLRNKKVPLWCGGQEG